MLAKRYELKYFIEDETAALLRKELKPHVLPDLYCQDQSSYEVNSLYFDTSDYEFFSQKIEGQKYRHKIRLRSYGDRSDRIYLEMKKKINNCIYKVRAGADRESVLNILDSDMIYDGLFSENTCFKGVDEILYMARCLRVQPSVHVWYRRRALMGKKDSRLRITFDENIVSRHPSCGLSVEEKGDRLFPPGISVLEIKVNNSIPMWLLQIIEHFNLNLRSVSKYCHSIEKQNIIQCDMRY